MVYYVKKEMMCDELVESILRKIDKAYDKYYKSIIEEFSKMKNNYIAKVGSLNMYDKDYLSKLVDSGMLE